MKWIYLLIVIISEVIATSFLKESAGLTKPIPAAIALISYGVTYYSLSLALKQIPIGIAYATWGGVGIMLLVLVDYFRFHQKLDVPAIVGMVLIVLGVVIMQVFSKTLSS